jgi:signal transduction histidine kinase
VSSLKILLLEDVIDEAGLIERVIRKENIKFSMIRVDSRQQYINALSDFRPDLILSDHALPEFNSIEALKLARQYSNDIPFILVTGTVSEEFAVTCLKQGADDYILKSNLSRLPTAINQSLDQRRAVIQKQIAESELRVQNELLVQANSELSKINKELDSFVYSVSHNLKGPLSSILGVVNLMRIEKDQAAFPEYMDMIEQSVFKLNDTLMDIIAYSNNARSNVIGEKIDLRKMFLENFHKQVPSGMEFQVNYNESPLAEVIGDPYRLNLIISNLVSNSIKYSDPKKPIKKIELAVAVDDNLKIVISDNGVGIREDIIPKVFNMFYRGHEKSNGSGLGLYLVREAVEKLGGSINISSKTGEGTSFTITLPRYPI